MHLPSNNRIFFIIALFLAFFVLSATPLLATSLSETTGLEKTAQRSGLNNTGITDVPSAIGKIVGAGLSFIGVLFFILMIYGGFIWMLARGNEQEVTKAKDLITSAVIGLVIVLSAYAITYYVGDLLTKK